MRILFLCGALEPGKNGVGDYTRRLSGELIRQGHNISIISLNDCCVKIVSQEIQKSDETEVEVFRIPASIPAKERFAQAEKYIRHYNPEWLSLQFVPYSFQKRGLPFSLGKHLKNMSKGYKWHVMFHELWIGMDQDASFKDKVYGKMQQRIIRKLIYTLEPQFIHTQTHLYQQQLKKINIKVEILPLFSNIPVVCAQTRKFIKNINQINIVVFGSIHYGADINGFVDWIRQQEKRFDKVVHIDFIGANGDELGNWVGILDHQHISYTVHGRQKINVISEILSGAAIGLTTTPFVLVEKSGSVAAMLEHHLPVICLARNWLPDIAVDIRLLSSQVILWNQDLVLDEILSLRSIHSDNVHTIAQQLVKDL